MSKIEKPNHLLADINNCLCIAETFPDAEIVSTLWRQLRLTKQKLSSLRNVFLSYRKERKGFSQRTQLLEDKLFNFALFALSLRTLRLKIFFKIGGQKK